MRLSTMQRYPRTARAVAWFVIGAPAVVGGWVGLIVADRAWTRWDRAKAGRTS